MYLAGLSVQDADVLGLVRLHEARFDDTAEAIVVALEAGQPLIALSIEALWHLRLRVRSGPGPCQE